MYRFFFLSILAIFGFNSVFAEGDYREKLKTELQAETDKLDYLFAHAEKETSPLNRAVVFNMIGVEYQHVYQLDSALHYHQRAFNLLKDEYFEQEEMAVTLNKIGIVYLLKENNLIAADYFQLSAEKFQNQHLKANVYNNLALAQKYLGEPDKAIVSYQKSFRLFNDTEKTDKALDVKLNLAALHNSMGNDSIAKILFEETINAAKERKLDEQLFRAKSELAVIYRELMNFDYALQLHEECDDFFESNGYINYQISNLNNWAVLYGEMGRFQEEIDIYTELLNMCQDYDLSTYAIAIKTNLASSYTLQGEYEKAKQLLIEAEESAMEQKNNPYLISIYGSFTTLYKSIGESDNALFYSELENTLRDSLNEAERIKSVIYSEQEMQNEVLRDSLMRVYSDLTRISSDHKEQLKQNNLWIIIVTLLVALLALLWFIVQRTRVKKRKVEQEVEEMFVENSDLQKEVELKNLEITHIKEGEKKPYPTDYPILTEREKEVLTHLANGLSDAEIADKIFLSITTVRTHLRKAYVKINVKNRAQAAQFVNHHQL